MKLFEAELVVTHHTWAWACLTISPANLVRPTDCGGAERFGWGGERALSSSLVLDVLSQGRHREHLGTASTVELVHTWLPASSADLFVEVWEEEEVELCPVQVLHVFTVLRTPADCPSAQMSSQAGSGRQSGQSRLAWPGQRCVCHFGPIDLQRFLTQFSHSGNIWRAKYTQTSDIIIIIAHSGHSSSWSLEVTGNQI